MSLQSGFSPIAKQIQLARESPDICRMIYCADPVSPDSTDGRFCSSCQSLYNQRIMAEGLEHHRNMKALKAIRAAEAKRHDAEVTAARALGIPIKDIANRG